MELSNDFISNNLSYLIDYGFILNSLLIILIVFPLEMEESDVIKEQNGL